VRDAVVALEVMFRAFFLRRDILLKLCYDLYLYHYSLYVTVVNRQ
jgi:hypothetical protein